MERRVRKAINFDLDTKVMKEQGLYPKGYKLLKKSLKELGFKHRQGSGYVSNDKLDSESINNIIVSVLKENSWIVDCAKKVDVTDISRQHDLIDIIKDFAEQKAATDDELQGLNKQNAAKEREDLTQADKEVIDRIRKSKSGKEYSDLEAGKYSGNKESADMKMMRILAFFTDCDIDQMDRIYKSTNLYEPAKGNAYVDKLKTTAVKADREPKPNQKNVKRISSKSTGRSK